jgi:peptidoglycan/LPS O-acetylase OafA/YrhL
MSDLMRVEPVPDGRAIQPGAPPIQEKKPAREGSGYWRGLDGLRALAVLGVVVFHLAPGGLPGGFLGVDVFFVISGYLITSLIVRERSRDGRTKLSSFWMRRVRRLYPAIVVLVIVLIPVTALWDTRALVSSRPTFGMGLIYMTNWWFIFHHVPYFQTFGPPPLLLHLWSLAIEEQYYLIWPPLLVLLLRWLRPNRVAGIALVGAIGSAVLMILLYHGAGSVNRVYYGSDTHAEGLLLGSALGLLVPPYRLPRHIGTRTRKILDRSGAAALVGLVLLAFLSSQGDTFTWRGGLLLAVLLTGVAVVVGAHPATRLSKALAVGPLRWLGTRSYSVYLWQWPVVVLTLRSGALPMSGIEAVVVRIAAIAMISEVSYRFVEQPFRTRRAQAALRRLLEHSAELRWSAAAVGAVFAAAVVSLVTVAQVPALPEASIGTSTAAALAPIENLAPTPAERSTLVPATHPTNSTDPTNPTNPTTTIPSGPAHRVSVLAIGDSVMLAASAELNSVFQSAIVVDADVGRQPSAGLVRLAAYRSAGRLQGLRALVLGLGSNGPFTAADLTQVRQLVAGVPLVVLINVRVSDSWGAVTNQTIDSVAGAPGFKVVDWYGASARPGLLWPDGVHPDPAGQQVYATLVAQAVTSASTVGTPAQMSSPSSSPTHSALTKTAAKTSS